MTSNSKYTPPSKPFNSAQFGVMPTKFSSSESSGQLAGNGHQPRFGQFASTVAPPAKSADPRLAPGPTPGEQKFNRVLDLLRQGRSGPTAATNNLSALKLIIASDTAFTDQSRGAETQLREAIMAADGAARATGHFGLAMRLLRSSGQGNLQKALQHLAAVQNATKDGRLASDVQIQVLAASQLQIGLAMGEESSPDYFLPALRSTDQGTRAAANMNIANRYYYKNPAKAAEHYAAAVKLTTNPITRQNAVNWMRELGYSESGQKSR